MAKRRKSTRKTFKKKGSAKSARKKGQSIYKVKGGYRLSKKRRGFSIVAMMAILVMMAVMFVSGCAQLDTAVEHTDKIAQAAAEVANSPAAKVVPSEFLIPAKVSIGALIGLCGLYIKTRKDLGLYKTATKEIIAAGEHFKGYYKAGNDAITSFGIAQDKAQSTSTKLLVSKIKAA